MTPLYRLGVNNQYLATLILDTEQYNVYFLQLENKGMSLNKLLRIFGRGIMFLNQW